MSIVALFKMEVPGANSILALICPSFHVRAVFRFRASLVKIAGRANSHSVSPWEPQQRVVGNRRWNAKQPKGWTFCRRRFVEAHRRQPSHPTAAIQSLDLPLARARRCAHLDKLNYKLDGSLVATRGNVVGAWICMIYTRNPTHRYNSRQPVARVGEPWETDGETVRFSLNSTSIQCEAFDVA